MNTQETLKTIIKKTDEMLPAIRTASTNWIEGRIDEIQVLARNALAAEESAEPEQPAESDQQGDKAKSDAAARRKAGNSPW